MDRNEHELCASLELSEVPEWRTRFPGLAAAGAAALEVRQAALEALFVPSGWHHSVENLEDTISINHNWLNAHNIAGCIAQLAGAFKRAEVLLDDCRCGPGARPRLLRAMLGHLLAARS